MHVGRAVHRRAPVRPARHERQQHGFVLFGRLCEGEGRPILPCDGGRHMRRFGASQIIMSGCSRCGTCKCSRFQPGSAASSWSERSSRLSRTTALRRFLLASYISAALVLTTLLGMALLGPRPSGFFARLAVALGMLAVTLHAGLHSAHPAGQPARSDRRRRPCAVVLGSSRRHPRGMTQRRTRSHSFRAMASDLRSRGCRPQSSKPLASTSAGRRHDAGVKDDESTAARCPTISSNRSGGTRSP